VVDGNVVLCDSRREFKVRVGDGAMGVVEGHQAVYNIRRKTRTPEERTAVAPRCKRRAVVVDGLIARARGLSRDRKPHAPHADAAGVLGAEDFGVWLSDDFIESSWPC